MYVSIVQTDQTGGSEVALSTKERRGTWKRGMCWTTCRAVRPNQQVGGYSHSSVMTTIVDALDGLDSNSLFAVRIL